MIKIFNTLRKIPLRIYKSNLYSSFLKNQILSLPFCTANPKQNFSRQYIRQKLEQARKHTKAENYTQSLKIYQQIKDSLASYQGSPNQIALAKSMWWMCLHRTGAGEQQTLPLMKEICQQFDEFIESGICKDFQNIDVFAYLYEAYASQVFEKKDKQEGLKLFEKAQKICEQFYTPWHKLTLSVKSKYATALEQLSLNPQKQFQLYDQAFQARCEAEGIKSEQMIRLRALKALARANYEPVLPYQDQILEIKKDILENLPKDHVGLKVFMPVLGRLYEEKSDFSKALQIYKELVQLRSEEGVQSPKYNHALHYLASCYNLMADHSSAQNLIQEQLVKLGAPNQKKALVVFNMKFLLAFTLSQMDIVHDTLKINLELKRDIPELYRTKRVDEYLVTLSQLVSCYDQLKEFDAALKINEQLYELSLQIKDEYFVNKIKFWKALLLLKKDQINEGLKIRDELKQFIEEKLDKNDPMYERYIEIKDL